MRHRSCNKYEAALSRKRLRARLRYDPVTGEFSWVRKDKRAKTTRAGTRAVNANNHRHVDIQFDGYAFKAHRLAWFYVTGRWPKDEIDHADCDGWNNCWSNLREATHRENMFNRKMRIDNVTGVKGVHFSVGHNRYVAKLNGGRLGYFQTLAEATAVRKLAARESHGEFYRER
jgi:hypothetical protein